MTFVLKEPTVNFDEREPKARFQAPTTEAEFVVRCWMFAPPAEYSIRAIKIVQLVAPSRIRCQFFLKSGELDRNEIDIDLDDLDQAFKRAPSTIGELPGSLEELKGEDCALLCVTDRILARLPTDVRQELWLKYPYAEDSVAEAKLDGFQAAARELYSIVKRHHPRTRLPHCEELESRFPGSLPSR